jgi:OOP family OmpA-OmpF porin
MSVTMISHSAKAVILTALIAFTSALSGTAQADIVRSTDGAPVLSSDGNCVLNGWEGQEKCEAAKAEYGMGTAPVAQETTKIDRERVVYFNFNKATLTPQARHQLDRLAKKIHMMNKHGGGTGEINVVGYADRLGNADYNQKLSMKRAVAVRNYLVGKGVKAKKVEVRALGKSDPRANCPPDMKRAKLIDCLKEDRRVEIEFAGHE